MPREKTVPVFSAHRSSAVILICGMLISQMAGFAFGQESRSQRRMPERVSEGPLEQLQKLLYEQRVRDLQTRQPPDQQQLNLLLQTVQSFGGRSTDGPFGPSGIPMNMITGLGGRTPDGASGLDEATRLMRWFGQSSALERLQQLLDRPRRDPIPQTLSRRRGSGRFSSRPSARAEDRYSTSPMVRQLLERAERSGGLDNLLSNLMTGRPLSSGIDPELHQLLREVFSGTGSPAPSDGPFDIADELSKNGLGSTLRRLFQDAQKEAKDSSSPNSGMFNSVVMEALESMRGDINGIIQHLDEATIQDAANSQTMPGLSVESALSDPEDASSLQSRLAGAVDGSDEGSSSGSSSTFGGARSPSPATERGQLDLQSLQVSVIFAAIVGCAACWLGLKLRNRSREVARRQLVESTAIRPADIHSREDVVAAFHWLTRRDACGLDARCPEAWWTHRRAAQMLADDRPAIRQPLSVLTEIYEWARYNTRDNSSSGDRILAARNALAGCLG